MASSPQLSIDAFPAWARLNDVDFTNTKLQETDGKGLGLVAEELESLQESGDGDSNDGKCPTTTTAPTVTTLTRLMRIPHDLVLSVEAVEEYAKVDQNFRQLLDVAGHQSTRGNILLYLLTHLVLPKRDHAVSRGGASTPWTEYIKFLPRQIPVPTMWTEVERALLQGTSLEAALDAKLSTLMTEFDELHEKTSELQFWNALFWEKGNATIDDWVLVDAWYRSRCLELPRAGDAMVPGLDMVNHSAKPTAYYEEDDKDDILLVLRPSSGVTCGEEITISYGEAKSAAEMLFSYGFVDPDSANQELVLPLGALPDDPLGRAKLHISRAVPSVKLSRTDGRLEWHSPFAYLMVLNEEDGLEFRLLQEKDGEQQLKLFWQDEDVTTQTDEFEALIRDHALCPVFRLRVVAVLHELVSTQLARMERSEFSHDQLAPLQLAGLVREECILAAEALRVVETSLLESAVEALETEKTHLLADDHVVVYLGSMEVTQNEQASAMTTNEEDDFS
ncbi:Fc.00g101140.m01.CDS01 [Cosmosporella sp. VM-42]